jgi:hypothetical protein
MKQIWEVDSEGNIIDLYLMTDDEIQKAKDEGRFMLDLDRGKFYRPKYNHSLGQWEETDRVGLQKTFINGKMIELSRKCNETILGKFSSQVNGVTYYFSNDMEAQANFEKCDRAFEKGRLTDIAWTCYNTNDEVVRLVLTPETFEQVYLDHLYHIQNNISKLRDFLMPMVDSSISEEDLKKITWNMSLTVEEPTQEEPVIDEPTAEEAPQEEEIIV